VLFEDGPAGDNKGKPQIDDSQETMGYLLATVDTMFLPARVLNSTSLKITKNADRVVLFGDEPQTQYRSILSIHTKIGSLHARRWLARESRSIRKSGII
jgi:hypothetical protein